MKIRAERFDSVEALRGAAICLAPLGENRFRVLTPEAAIRVEQSDFAAWLLVADTPAGRQASQVWPDYRSRTHPPKGGPAMTCVKITADPDRGADGAIERVTLAPGRGDAGWPLQGDRFFLFQRFQDWVSDDLIACIHGLDGTTGLAMRFLTDPAALARAWPRAWPTLTLPRSMTASQRSVARSLQDHQLTCLIGPPGTGKTWTLAQLIRSVARALAGTRRRATIAVVAPTHTALDEIERKLVKGRALPRGARLDRLDNGTPTRPDCQVWVALATAQRFRRVDAGDLALDWLIIDEASQMTLPTALAALRLVRDDGRVLLVGDDQQMPPILHGVYPDPDDGYDPDRADGTGPRFSPTRSVFAHALTFLPPGAPGREALCDGWRMNDVLTSAARALIYRPVLAVEFQPGSQRVRAARLEMRRPGRLVDDIAHWILDPGRPLVMVEIDHQAASLESAIEAALVAQLARAMRATAPLEDGDTLGQHLFVVAPHHVHIAAIRRALTAVLPDDSVVIDTVEKVQGQERDAVVVSYGVSDPDLALAEGDFIYDRNRLNVALSRARHKAVLILSRALMNPPTGLLATRKGMAGFQYLCGLERACTERDQVRANLGGQSVGLRLMALNREMV